MVSKIYECKSPVFIVGPSRSGTELVRSILNKHSGIYIVGETHYFDDLRTRLDPTIEANQPAIVDGLLRIQNRPYGLPLTTDNVLRSELVVRAASHAGGIDSVFEAYCEMCAEHRGKVRWGEKTPRHIFRIEEILEGFPAAKIIIMVRDARSVIASYRDWSAGIDKLVARGRLTAEDISRESRRVRASYHPLVLGLLWNAAINCALRARRKHGSARIYTQQFENLIVNPREEIERLLWWLELPFEPDLLEVPVINSSYSNGGDSRTGFQQEAHSRWLDTLTESEVAVIQLVCARHLQRFNYKMTVVRGGWSAIICAVATLGVAAVKATFANRGRFYGVSKYILVRLRSAIGL